MTLCHYSDVLQILSGLAGLSYSMEVGASGLSVDEERAARVAVNTQLQMLWPLGKWPGVVRVEQRSFRAFWSSGTTYGAGNNAPVEVYDPLSEKYFQSLRAANLNQPPSIDDAENSEWWAECAASYGGEDWEPLTVYAVGTKVYREELNRYYQCHTAHTSGATFGGSTYWGILWPFDPYISYTQSGETEIWQESEITLWDQNPRLSTRAVPVGSFLSENGIQALGNYPARPFVEFKIRVPNLVGEVWDEEETYAEDDQVQFETSSGKVPVIDFYQCLTATAAGESPTTAAAKWEVVEIPDIFKTYLGAKSAVAWLCGEEDSRLIEANRQAGEAMDVLMNTLYRVQQQIPRTNQRCYA